MPHLAHVDQILSDVTVVFDVRSPLEYQQGHIPCALNLPLFSDAERAQIGALYKQKGQNLAVLQGLDFAGPKMRGIVETASLYARPKKAALYCWRGGMRSQAVGLLLEFAGFEVSILQAGYKAYRKWVREVLSRKRRLIVIGGPTGVGKAWILQALRKRGEQILDLESIAGHRGSSYGSLGLPSQPTQEHFENKLAYLLSSCDQRPIWIEDESRMIGTVKIPDPMFDQMRASPLLVVDRPRHARVNTLVQEYGHLRREELVTATERIRKRLGDQRTQQAIECIHRGDLHSMAHLVLHYYDRAYNYGLKMRPHQVIDISVAGQNPSAWAELIMRHYQRLEA